MFWCGWKKVDELEEGGGFAQTVHWKIRREEEIREGTVSVERGREGRGGSK